MSDHPAFSMPPNITIHPWSLESLGISLSSSQQCPFTSVANVAWPSANRALFVPFVLLEQITVKRLFWYNGLTTSQNVDAGVYDKNGVLLGSAGGVAQSGVGVIQSADVTDFTCGPGLFYLALVKDGTTGKIYQGMAEAGYVKAWGMFQMATAYPLPAVATFATCATDRVPVVGLSTRDLV